MLLREDKDAFVPQKATGCGCGYDSFASERFMHNTILSSCAFFHVAMLCVQASVALRRSAAAVGWMTKSDKTVTNSLVAISPENVLAAFVIAI